jgi:hypothetical protein
MYRTRRSFVAVALLSIFMLLSAMSPLPVTNVPARVNVKCGDVIPEGSNIIVESIQGPSLSGACQPKETNNTFDNVPVDLPKPSQHRTQKSASSSFGAFSISQTVPVVAETGFEINQYTSGLQGILANFTTNRSFSISSTGYQTMYLVIMPEDDQCIESVAIWARQSGVMTAYATVFNLCSGLFEYSASMNSTWASSYERNIWTGFPGYSNAVIETSSNCFRGTFYNYTLGTWEWKGNAACGVGSYSGLVYFQALANNSNSYVTYNNVDFDIMNGYTLNPSTGLWDTVPSGNKTVDSDNPPFANNPYKFDWGTTGSNLFYITAYLHT